MTSPIREKLKNLPQTAGVYLFKNALGKIIYVGKAKNLKSRTSSYFLKNIRLGTKTYALVSRINDMDHVDTFSELEALILEAELIRKYRPKYNVALKDDKSYLYIVFRNDKLELAGKTYKIPKIITARKPDLLPTDTHFGPFPSAYTTKYIIRTLRKVFPYRDCATSKFNRHKTLGRPCLYGHIGLCQAPCVQSISISEYKKEINKIKKFLRGDASFLIRDLEHKMTQSSKDLDFEKAAYYRDTLKRFEYVRANFRSAEKYVDNPNLVEDSALESLDALKQAIPILNVLPKRIECYDISNISGKEAVGSMVVATNGLIDKSEYKRFKIKLKNTPDDFYMMREVLARRLKHETITSEEACKAGSIKKWKTPDLIVLDGGKGQLSVISDLMSEIQVNVPVIGLAKKLETIVFSQNEDFVELNLSKESPALLLLVRLRDEAHRFAQSYHHHLRLKQVRV